MPRLLFAAAVVQLVVVVVSVVRLVAADPVPVSCVRK